MYTKSRNTQKQQQKQLNVHVLTLLHTCCTINLPSLLFIQILRLPAKGSTQFARKDPKTSSNISKINLTDRGRFEFFRGILINLVPRAFSSGASGAQTFAGEIGFKMAAKARKSMAYFKTLFFPSRCRRSRQRCVSNMSNTSACIHFDCYFFSLVLTRYTDLRKRLTMSSLAPLENSSKDLVELTPVFRDGETEQRKVVGV